MGTDKQGKQLFRPGYDSADWRLFSAVHTQLIVAKRPQLHVLPLNAARATAADTVNAGVPSKGSRGVDGERVRCLQLQVLDGTMTMAQYINETRCGG